MMTQRGSGWLRANSRGGQAIVAIALGLLLTGCGGRRSERVHAVPVMAPPPPTVAARQPDMTVIAAEPRAAPTTVVAATPSTPGSTTVVATNPPVAVSSVPSPSRAASLPPSRGEEWEPTAPDRFGFDGDRYLSLVTPEEVDILRLRSRGDMASHLSRFLSEKEKENLRRRAAELTEIGADPLQVGE